jgi:hypothetical protein
MTDDEIRAEIARQIHDTLSLLAASPEIAKALKLTADEIDQLP